MNDIKQKLSVPVNHRCVGEELRTSVNFCKRLVEPITMPCALTVSWTLVATFQKCVDPLGSFLPRLLNSL